MPACVEEMGAPSGPTEAGPAGSPMAAADHMSSKMEGQGQTHQDHSRDLLLCVDLHSSSLGPSGHSTFPRGCSMVDKEGEAGSGQKEAEEVHKSESVSPIVWSRICHINPEQGISKAGRDQPRTGPTHREKA